MVWWSEAASVEKVVGKCLTKRFGLFDPKFIRYLVTRYFNKTVQVALPHIKWGSAMMRSKWPKWPGPYLNPCENVLDHDN